MSRRNKRKKSGNGVGILGFGVMYALYSSIFKPHSLFGYLLAFALGGIVASVLRVMGQGLDTSVNQKTTSAQKAETVEKKDETPESLKKVQGKTGNPDVDALLSKGREMITEIRRENDLIPDSSLSDKLDKLENLCAEIFRAVYDKPEKAPQIRKFMDYYLPTTLKMVKGYRMLDERGVSGRDAVAAKSRIDDALGVVLRACDKMLDKLYQDDVLDLTTDIDVLEQMLKRDGLTESELEAAAAQARRAAQIDAAATRAAQLKAQRTQQEEEKQQEQRTSTRPPQVTHNKWHIDPKIQAKLDAEASAQARMPEYRE